MKKTAYLFPGQGTQNVGMGKDFYDAYPVAKETMQEANEILKRDLTKIIFEGPQDVLTETLNSQTALFVVSIAVLRVIQKQFPALQPFCTAGLSLGEYTALYGARKLSFADGLSLVDKRGQLMNEACEKNKGTMAVIIGLNAEQVVQLVKEYNQPQELCAANFNTPEQIVISGTPRGVEAGSLLAEAKGGRVIPLAVHGAFHSFLMKSAEDQLKPYIEKTPFTESNIGVVMNYSAQLVQDIAAIKEQLIKQVTNPVRWEQSVRTMMNEGVELYLEIGCGKTLAGMHRKIKAPGQILSIDKVADLELLQAL